MPNATLSDAMFHLEPRCHDAQIDPAFRGLVFISGTRQVITKSADALLTDFGPTAVGYLVQGGAKFAGYEDQEVAVKHRTAVHLGAASIADSALFRESQLTLKPTHIRLVSECGYAPGLVSGFSRLAREGGIREIYAGFLPILCEQIPYAIGQFTINELCHEIIYRSMTPETPQCLSPSANFTIALGSGIFAGFAAAILSQPADTLFSQINKGHGPTRSMVHRLTVLARPAGFSGLFAGLDPRIIMTAGLVSLQFLVYGAIKQALKAPPGFEIHKE
ncbi:Mitochondrial phosphate carrier protein [Termitomyces sp. J132]|nr:Mitochondrial phosphate carrier protein [Termitomyces sp. J132]